MSEILKSPDAKPMIDVRSADEYAEQAAIPTINIPFEQFRDNPDSLPIDYPKSESIYVICKSGGRSHMVCDILINQGYEKVFNVTGGTRWWVKAGLPTR